MIPHAHPKQDDELSIVSFDYEKTKEIKWYHSVLLNRPLKVILVLILVSILAPTLIYQFVFHSSAEPRPPDGFSFGSCLVPRTSRIPCGPGNIPQSECHRECCYDLQNNVCYHRVPSRFSYLVLNNIDWSEDVILKPRFGTVPYNSQPSITSIRLAVDEVSSSHLSFTFYDSRSMSVSGSRIAEKSYDYRILSPELNIIVYGSEEKEIFNTMRGPIIASDNIWEITFKLTNGTMYGLGELPLVPGTVKVIYNHQEGLSSIPLIFARANESYHGLLIDMKTPTEVSIQEDNQIIVRSITRSGLKLHLFTGPEPKDIMKDAMNVIGSQKQLDYWMLGAHVCSELPVADDAAALNNLNTFITTANRERVPYESHCGIKPIVFDAEEVATVPVANGARAVRNARRKFVPHVSPYIRYIEEVPITEEPTTEQPVTEGVVSEVTTTENIDSTTESITTTAEPCLNVVCEFEELMLHKESDSDLKLYTGLAHEHSVVYPDYAHENAIELLDRLWGYNMELDGIILENNWPLDESEKNEDMYDQLPYFNEHFSKAFSRAPQWNTKRPESDLYIYTHNEYGSHFMDALWAKFNQTPPSPTWSSSVWFRNDAVVNRQGVKTSWLSLRQEMVAAALGGASGQWFWSTPICGDTEDFNATTQASLCAKWYMAATYFPMIKIHSKGVARDPLAFQGTHKTHIMRALTRRMSLMAYFFSILQEGPLLRPMFYQYPFSEELVNMNTQFGVGDDLLIAPNLVPSQSHVHVRMPEGTWYEFWSGLRIESEEGEFVTLTTTEADFVTLVRGGSIIPLQKVAMENAELTRRNADLSLLVATKLVNVTRLHNKDDEEIADEEIVETEFATGRLNMASDMVIHLSVQERQLLITREGEGFDSFCGGTQAVWTSFIRNIDIYGLPDAFNNFDNHRSVNILQGINLCNLQTQDTIVFALT